MISSQPLPQQCPNTPSHLLPLFHDETVNLVALHGDCHWCLSSVPESTIPSGYRQSNPEKFSQISWNGVYAKLHNRTLEKIPDQQQRWPSIYLCMFFLFCWAKSCPVYSAICLGCGVKVCQGSQDASLPPTPLEGSQAILKTTERYFSNKSWIYLWVFSIEHRWTCLEHQEASLGRHPGCIMGRTTSTGSSSLSRCLSITMAWDLEVLIFLSWPLHTQLKTLQIQDGVQWDK